MGCAGVCVRVCVCMCVCGCSCMHVYGAVCATVRHSVLFTMHVRELVRTVMPRWRRWKIWWHSVSLSVSCKAAWYDFSWRSLHPNVNNLYGQCRSILIYVDLCRSVSLFHQMEAFPVDEAARRSPPNEHEVGRLHRSDSSHPCTRDCPSRLN